MACQHVSFELLGFPLDFVGGSLERRLIFAVAMASLAGRLEEILPVIFFLPLWALAEGRLLVGQRDVFGRMWSAEGAVVGVW